MWWWIRVSTFQWRYRTAYKLYNWLAWKMPKGLVEEAYIRAMRHAEKNPYNDGNPLDISVMWALCYWQTEGKNEITR
jgi:hypothetical protein